MIQGLTYFSLPNGEMQHKTTHQESMYMRLTVDYVKLVTGKVYPDFPSKYIVA